MSALCTVDQHHFHEFKARDNRRSKAKGGTPLLLNSKNREVDQQEAYGNELYAALVIGKYWGKVPPIFQVRFIDPIRNDEVCEQVVKCMNEWSKYANVQFVDKDKPNWLKQFDNNKKSGKPRAEVELRVTFRGDGYWARVGTDLLHPDNHIGMCLANLSLGLGEVEFKRIVIHETGHILGLTHEHMREAIISRIDHQAMITYALAVYGWDEATTRAQILTPAEDEDIYATEYADELSIMCYNLPASVMVTRQDLVGGHELSVSDKVFINTIYPKGGQHSDQGFNNTIYHKGRHGGRGNGNSYEEKGNDHMDNGVGLHPKRGNRPIGEIGQEDGEKDLSSSPLALRSLMQNALTPSSSILRAPQEMTPGDRLMSSLVNLVIDSLTASVNKNSPLVDPSTSYIQFAIGTPINPDSFNRMVSPLYPMPPDTELSAEDEKKFGDLGQTEEFSKMVNTFNNIDIETTYRQIVTAAGAVNNEVDSAQNAAYEKAMKILYTTTKNAKGVEVYQETPLYRNYKKKEAALTNAVVNYRATQSEYDFTKRRDQTQWRKKKPLLDLKVKQASDAFNAAKPIVEDALLVLSTFGKSLAKTVLSDSKKIFESTAVDSVVDDTKYHIASCFPYDWASRDDGYSTIGVSSKQELQTTNESNTSWSASGGYGFFFNAEAGGSKRTSKVAESASNMEISLKYALVRIERPWLFETLFRIGGWVLRDVDKGGISSGKIPATNEEKQQLLLPSYPTHFIVVKNVNMKADWSTKTKESIESQLKVGAGIGYGLFKLGGSYSSSSKNESFQSSFSGNTISIPGMQIIGWVNKIVPFSPQVDGRTK